VRDRGDREGGAAVREWLVETFGVRERYEWIMGRPYAMSSPFGSLWMLGVALMLLAWLGYAVLLLPVVPCGAFFALGAAFYFGGAIGDYRGDW
jgi:hypothetical protein